VKIVILDRDGVINEDSDNYIKTEREWQPIAGSIEAIARLSRAGFSVYVATNQSGLGRGLFAQSDLDAMHTKLNNLVAEQGGSLKGIYYCPHQPEDACRCRKPDIGLLEQIAQDSGQSLKNAPLVGDSLRDLESALGMGCQPILVKTGKGSGTLGRLEASSSPLLGRLLVYDNLADAADAIIAADQCNTGQK
jgi:D-glycero-D-manno-heptose 1,7-bisphosphate phosphatase